MTPKGRLGGSAPGSGSGRQRAQGARCPAAPPPRRGRGETRAFAAKARPLASALFVSGAAERGGGGCRGSEGGGDGAAPAWGFLRRIRPPGVSAGPAAPSPGGRGRASGAPPSQLQSERPFPAWQRGLAGEAARGAGAWLAGTAGGAPASGKAGGIPWPEHPGERGLHGHRSAGLRAGRWPERSPHVFRNLISVMHICV